MYKLPGSNGNSERYFKQSKSAPKFQKIGISKLPSIKNSQNKLKKIQSNFCSNVLPKIRLSQWNIDKTTDRPNNMNYFSKVESNITPISKQELITILTKYKNKINKEKEKMNS